MHATPLVFSLALFSTMATMAVARGEESSQEVVEERRIDEAAGIEDIEAKRCALAQAGHADAPEVQSTTELTFYGSARVHAINTFDLETNEQKSRAGDGNSRIGLRRAWHFHPRWYAALLYSRLANMETTDQGRYFDADGLELYSQWEVVDKWRLIGG